MNMKETGKVRKKVWAPRTRAGCKTCRIRRVKCDEQRPACNRCASTGRTCDYLTSNISSSSSCATLSGETTNFPNRVLCVSLSKSGPRLEMGNPDEQSSFHFFLHFTAPQLKGLFRSGFWEYDILRISNQFPAVRHAIAALGTMHQLFLTGEIDAADDCEPDPRIRFALKQSNKSIRHVTDPSSSDATNKEVVLVVCLLFYCLATIQGQQSEAIEHAYSGLRLLEEISVEEDTGDESDPEKFIMYWHDELPAKSILGQKHTKSSPRSLDFRTIRAMVLTLDAQAREMVNNLMVRPWSKCTTLDVLSLPQRFSTIWEAKVYLDSLHRDILSFIYNISLQSKAAQKQYLHGFYPILQQRRLKRWDEAFLTLLKTPNLSKDIEDKKALLVIKLWRCVAELCMSILARNIDGLLEESQWDSYIPNHRELLDLSKQILALDDPTNLSNGSKKQRYFTFECGIVAPLFLVATRSRDPTTRRRAIDMLLRNPRREGLWDSTFAGRLSFQIMMLEEQGSGWEDLHSSSRRIVKCAQDVPEEMRLRTIDIVYVGHKKARVCITTQQQMIDAGFGAHSRSQQMMAAPLVPSNVVYITW